MRFIIFMVIYIVILKVGTLTERRRKDDETDR